MPEQPKKETKPQKSIPSHIIKTKKAKRKSKENKEKTVVKSKTMSNSDSGSSINSQKNKSNLEHLRKNIDSNKKGFLLKMNIDQKNLKK
jgi:hypothetical protein